ncbi:MAG TPA: chromate resistance protein ChrB domain-containing protein [Steroidobacteraceae bacterium]|nr:chromate resistance protein ChrB domain-containing protein [Steroidobacteraceae bacterium]
MNTSNWLLFVTNLPGRNQTLRMRVWRSLKASGAGTLRDGAYVLPTSDTARQIFERQQREIQGGGGTAYILELAGEVGSGQGNVLRALFDRTPEYEAIAAMLQALREDLAKLDEGEARRRLVAARREAAALSAVDFFPGESRVQLDGAMTDAESALTARFSPEEPHSAKGRIQRLDRKNYRGRVWATRQRLWIDRVCSAWLIRRFIDPKARFIWLKSPKDCPKRAIGFDFDGAPFTHIDSKVTFEVLVASFALENDAALSRLGALVHYLDVGGIPVAEAAGFAAIVSGARTLQPDDDALLKHVSPILDSLYHSYASLEHEGSAG